MFSSVTCKIQNAFGSGQKTTDPLLDITKHAGKGLLQVVGTDQNFVGCLSGESPAEGNCTVERGLAALLDATVQDRVVGQAASAIEGEGSRNISR